MDDGTHDLRPDTNRLFRGGTDPYDPGTTTGTEDPSLGPGTPSVLRFHHWPQSTYVGMSDLGTRPLAGPISSSPTTPRLALGRGLEEDLGPPRGPGVPRRTEPRLVPPGTTDPFLCEGDGSTDGGGA